MGFIRLTTVQPRHLIVLCSSAGLRDRAEAEGPSVVTLPARAGGRADGDRNRDAVGRRIQPREGGDLCRWRWW